MKARLHLTVPPLYTRIALVLLLTVLFPLRSWALASNNIPLDSPVYEYLDKLASYGLISSDFKGIRPITRAEAARLLGEAVKKRDVAQESDSKGPAGEYVITVRHYPEVREEESREPLADEMVKELRHALERETALRESPESAPRFAARPLSEFRARYVYLDGIPRSYEHPVHDPGGEGVFGIGSGLRPDNPPSAVANQHGTEGTPLMENNNGVTYGSGSNFDLRFSSEAFVGQYLSALVEPMFLYEERTGFVQGRLNKGYAKLGGGGLELEVGRDENWLGIGKRSAITLTNNAPNFDLIKLSNPEPLGTWLGGKFKYDMIFSRFNKTGENETERHPFFMGVKLSLKPTGNLELGFNLGRQFGGPGVKNTLGSVLRGLVGGTNDDDTNNLAGLEFCWRVPFLRNTELYIEYSGEDAAKFWPIVESYVGGIYIPRLTSDGRNDFRFEYYQGNRILYTHSNFQEGYIYDGMPIGDSQGGAAQEFYFRYRHWFAARNNGGLEYIHSDRGKTGRLPNQGLEEKNSWRISWNYPVLDHLDAGLIYGWEHISNMNLVEGVKQTNQLAKIDLTYRY
jgi:Capsule assembly protein Wzi